MHVSELVKLDKPHTNVFSLDGDDGYFLKAAERWFASLIPEEFRAMNLTVIDKINDFDDVKNACRSYPFGSEYTVVIVRDSAFRAVGKGEVSEDGVEKTAVSAFIKSVPPDCVLVFENSAFLSPSDRLVIENVSAAKLEASDLRATVKAMFPCGVKPDALEKLIDYAQRDMSRIETEAAKLSAYKNGAEVEASDVEQLVVPDSDFRVYQFTGAIAEGRKGEAARILDRLLKQGEAPQFLMSAIITHYRRLLHCALSPLDDKSLAAIFKVKEYAVKKQRQTAARYTKMRLKTIMDKLTELEYKARSGELNDRSAFKRAVAFLYEA